MLDYPPVEMITDPVTQALTLITLYIDNFPIIYAYGYELCLRLATLTPDHAVLDADSVAYAALGM